MKTPKIKNNFALLYTRQLEMSYPLGPSEIARTPCHLDWGLADWKWGNEWQFLCTK